MKIIAVILNTVTSILNDDTVRLMAATAGRLLLHILIWAVDAVGNIQ